MGFTFFPQRNFVLEFSTTVIDSCQTSKGNYEPFQTQAPKWFLFHMVLPKYLDHGVSLLCNNLIRLARIRQARVESQHKKKCETSLTCTS